ncbi:MAG: nucleoside diphosphate kinase, nucleoside-diphosphate kinase [Patescibacteria group bacterium]|nr:nucleoside diphosphate kinase, nucleoside-diphosphate kinase [Patescibacteria group bacterium]
MKPDEKRLEELRHERSLVLIKPDAVARHLVGEILQRFERKGLKIAALKLVWPTEKMAGDHYVATEEWLMSSGKRAYDSYVAKGMTPPAEPRDIGLNTRRTLMEGLTAGPVVAMVLEGAHVIEVVRKIRGNTSPLQAEVGTIGFDYSMESYEVSNAGDWAVKNIIHGSDSADNYAREVAIWFKPEEVVNYETVLTEVAYTKKWYPKNK